MTFEDLYKRLQEQATNERGHAQVFHEADIDGYHLYMADTSFGFGPQMSISGPDHLHGWGCEGGPWLPVTRDTDEKDAEFTLALAERAEWHSRFKKLDPNSVGQ